MSPEVQAALAYGECRDSSSDYDLLTRIEGSNTPAQAAAEILAAEVRRLSEDAKRLDYIISLFSKQGSIDGCDFYTMDRAEIDTAMKGAT